MSPILTNQHNPGPGVVIAGLFTFPRGSASASRIRNLALGLVETGASVHAISMVLPCREEFDEATSSNWTYQGITYEFSTPHSLVRKPSRPPTALQQFSHRLIWLRGIYASVKPALASLEHLVQDGRCDLFLGYGRMLSVMRPLLRVCRRRRTISIVDVVERPGSCVGFGGRLSPLWWEERLGSAYLARHCDGLTTITTTLRDYYKELGAKKILVLPSLAERKGSVVCPAPDRTQPVTLAHVGTLSDRDNPALMFDVMRVLATTGNKIRLRIFGRYHAHATGRRWLDQCRRESSLRSVVEFVGELSDEELCRNVSKADALILMRRNTYSEWASFPTRLVEYLEFGLPVFVSAVGDIPQYLEHNRDAILLDGEDPRTIAESIRSVISRPDRGRSIGLSGKRRGEYCFDRALHARRLLEFAAQLKAEPEVT